MAFFLCCYQLFEELNDDVIITTTQLLSPWVARAEFAKNVVVIVMSFSSDD